MPIVRTIGPPIRSWVTVALLIAPPALAQETATPDAQAILQRMATELASADKFEVDMDTSWDVIQPNGQKIEVGEVRDVVLDRPDRLRVDARTTEGTHHGLIYNGHQIAIFDVEQNVYSTIDVGEAGVRPALKTFTEDLGMRFPLAELFTPDLPDTLASQLDDVTLVGRERLRGKDWYHVAGRGDVVDVQFWVPVEGPALPGRVVLTYKETPGQPEYRADFEHWDLDPKIRADEFTFTPRRGAQRIAVTPVRP